MKVEVNENRDIVLKEVFCGVKLVTEDGEWIGICMRDSGFEFNYLGTWYSAQKGTVKAMGTQISQIYNSEDSKNESPLEQQDQDPLCKRCRANIGRERYCHHCGHDPDVCIDCDM